jgi:hypothetical protein
LAKLYNRATPAADQTTRQQFEAEMANSMAVLFRSMLEVVRLVRSDDMLYNTYYQQIESDFRLPSQGSWDALRCVADARVFPYYGEKIRFAALTLDLLRRLDNYGDCSVILETEMIQDRATVFWENSTAWACRYDLNQPLPSGYRATWADRIMLAVAKLAGQLRAGVGREQFPGLLLQSRMEPTGTDEFIEVNIWGPLTRRAFSHVIVTKKAAVTHANLVYDFAVQLCEIGVPLSVQL